MIKANTYKLTAAGEKLYQVLINPEHLGKNVEELCTIADVGRNTYYRLMKEEGFTRLVSETSQKLVMAKIGDVVNATYKYAIEESKGHQDRKMLLTMAGLYAEKTDATVNANVTRQNNAYDELTVDELKKLINNE